MRIGRAEEEAGETERREGEREKERKRERERKERGRERERERERERKCSADVSESLLFRQRDMQMVINGTNNSCKAKIKSFHVATSQTSRDIKTL